MTSDYNHYKIKMIDEKIKKTSMSDTNKALISYYKSYFFEISCDYNHLLLKRMVKMRNELVDIYHELPMISIIIVATIFNVVVMVVSIFVL